ncbi:MAG: hypothetical protein K8S98_07905 [Planctomycetes bacterium]|nr:hypothetical protein [Planctomycetota bacterium]
MRTSRGDEKSATTVVRRELVWALGLTLAGAAWFVIVARHAESRAFVVATTTAVLAPLSAFAAYREPRLGCLLPYAIWLGAAATYVIFFRDPYWQLGVPLLLLYLAPCFVAALVAQQVARHRRRA